SRCRPSLQNLRPLFAPFPGSSAPAALPAGLSTRDAGPLAARAAGEKPADPRGGPGQRPPSSDTGHESPSLAGESLGTLPRRTSGRAAAPADDSNPRVTPPLLDGHSTPHRFPLHSPTRRRNVLPLLRPLGPLLPRSPPPRRLWPVVHRPARRIHEAPPWEPAQRDFGLVRGGGEAPKGAREEEGGEAEGGQGAGNRTSCHV
ncbi:hypothetical protein DFJ74DRAFT_767153, partial [Hyaloraphidium curvatum]